MCHQRQCFSMQKNLLLQLLLCTKRRWALSWWKQQFLMGIAKLWGSWAMVGRKNLGKEVAFSLWPGRVYEQRFGKGLEPQMFPGEV